MPYSYISLLLRIDSPNGMETVYTRGAGINEDSLVEPGAVIQRFLNARDCYILQSEPEGHYFSYIGVYGGNYYMLTCLLHDEYSASGSKLLNLFTILKRQITNSGTLDDGQVDQAFKAAALPEQGVMSEAWKYEPHQPHADAAYRTYVSLTDLETIFSFPSQPDYENYRCIIVVSATSNLRAGVKIPRITAQVKKQYSVSCPPGVTVSQPLAFDGDTLRITYTRPGFDPQEEEMVVGNSMVYGRTEGATLKIKPAHECGINFTRRVPIEVISTKGTPLIGYNIEVNGHPVTVRDGFFELTEHDIVPGQPVEITVSSNNYQPLTVNENPETIGRDTLVLKLDPVEQGVTLRLDFGENRVIDVNTNIEKNTSEYIRLHSGRFHGYRAVQRAQRGDDGSELYYIDLKQPIPVETSTHRQATSSVEKREKVIPESPKFENLTVETSTAETPKWVKDEVEETVNEEAEGKFAPYKKWMILGVAIILVIVGLAIFWPEGESIDNQPVTVADAAADSNQPEALPTVDEQADYNHLNANQAWDKNTLKSPTARCLIDALNNGDIDGVVNHPYFKKYCTSDKASKVADLLWQAKGSESERANVKKMKATASQTVIDLDVLYKELMRVRPLQVVNNGPRPTK